MDFLGIIFGLSYAVFAGFGKVVLKKSLNSFPSSVSFFWESVFGMFLWVPISMTIGVDYASIPSILPIIILGAVLSEAYIFYIYSKGDISIIGAIFPSYSLFTILFSIILISERPTLLQVLSALVIFVGVILISLSSFKKNLSFVKNISPSLWALSGAIAVGVADSLGKGVINETSSFTLLFTLAFVQIPVSLIFLRIERQDFKDTFTAFRDFEKYRLSLIAAFLIALAQLFFWLSFENTLASVASPITSSVSMFTVIFAYLFLEESLGRVKILGVLFVFFGVVLLGLV